ncbi:uncharacterized protein LOC124366426 [Homalodisca vitripennis]|uniref:uncharacterized protein LOC124366426 n=1 Tax=Homalodisca vitripennis TaxID=197043 RepID=UPI001EEA0EDC|nr:uncharacterized protein LOC124366426 [Homalodisca vitripennis]
MVLELTAVEMSNVSTILVSVYRSPSGDFEHFIDLLDLCLNYLSKLKVKNIVLCGDFNIHLEIPSREEAAFSNLLRSYGLYITSRVPTRGAACLDAAATNADSWNTETEVVNPLVADHGAVVLTISTDMTTRP